MWGVPPSRSFATAPPRRRERTASASHGTSPPNRWDDQWDRFLLEEGNWPGTGAPCQPPTPPRPSQEKVHGRFMNILFEFTDTPYNSFPRLLSFLPGVSDWMRLGSVMFSNKHSVCVFARGPPRALLSHQAALSIFNDAPPNSSFKTIKIDAFMVLKWFGVGPQNEAPDTTPV